MRVVLTLLPIVCVNLIGACSEHEPRSNSDSVVTEPKRLTQEEKREFLREYFKQRRAKVVATTVTPSGEVIDWIPKPPAAEPPPPPTAASVDPNATTEMTEPPPTDFVDAKTWLDLEPSLRGPEGTVPQQYIDVEKLIANHPELPENPLDIFRKMAPNPTATGYYYVQWNRQNGGPYYGTRGGLNIWSQTNYVAGDNSIVQAAVSKGSGVGTDFQTVEAGVVTSQPLNSNANLHFFTYFTTNNYSSETHWVGGWNTVQNGWVQVSGTVFPGSQIVNSSAWAGTQVESVVEIRISGGAWWVWALGGWVGYYPRCIDDDSSPTCATLNKDYLFAPSGLRTTAAFLSWYGEIFDANYPNATPTDMGSGYWGGGSPYGIAAYLREIAEYTAPTTYSHWTTASPNTFSITDSYCYTKNGPYQSGASPWLNWMYVGGSGDDEVDCVCGPDDVPPIRTPARPGC